MLAITEDLRHVHGLIFNNWLKCIIFLPVNAYIALANVERLYDAKTEYVKVIP
jgi:hypothetical protein